MRKNTVVTLVASVGFGILAVTLARGWINDAVTAQQKEIQKGSVVETYKPNKTTPVLVANVDLGFGDVLTADMLRLVDMPEDIVPLKSYSQLNSLLGDGTKPVTVLERVNRNEPLLSYKVTAHGSGGSLASLISSGHRAVSVRVDAVSGVGGLVMPEDRVDVIFIHNSNTGARGVNLESKILLQNIRVLGIDQNLRNAEKTPNIAKTVTLEVTQEDAQKLQLALDAGKLSLTLRSAGDVSIEKTMSVTTGALSNARPVSHQPKSKPKPARAHTKSIPDSKPMQSQVTIIRGDERDEVSVRREDIKASTDVAGG